MKRGDFVLVDYPFHDVKGSKVRPAVVVQSDAENAASLNTVVVMVTSNLAGDGRPVNCLVNPATPEGRSSGLKGVSLVKCTHLATVRQILIIRRIGWLHPNIMAKVDFCLRAALNLP